MARQVLGGLTTLNLATNLDPMFLELYNGTPYISVSTFTVGDASAGNKTIIVDGPTALGSGAAIRLRRGGVDSVVLGTAGILGGAEATDGVLFVNGNNKFRLYTNSVERFSIDGSGNVGIGTNVPIAKMEISTSVPTAGTLGVRINDAGTNMAVQLMRTGATYSYGGVGANEAWLYNQGASTLSIGPDGAGVVRFVANGSERLRVSPTGVVTPGADNTQTLGSGALRWSTVYAGTGAINTSDAREKTAVHDLDTAELDCAMALSKEIGSFKFLSSVAQKNAGARLHIGMTVQRAMEVMESFGLDPLQYAFICHDKWPAENDEEGKETKPAGDRYGFRADELGLFIMRGLAARLDALEG